MRNTGKTPKLRFPEFQGDPEWHDRPLGEVVGFESGGTPSKQNPQYWNGLIPWASAKDMKVLFLDDTEDHITSAAADDGARKVPAGTVLLLTRGMTLFKDVPICVLRRPMSFNQDVKALRAKGDLSQEFLPYLLLANRQKILGIVDAAGHGTGRLDTDKLRSLNVMHPRGGSEQNRIANCLTSLENLIPALSDKLEALKIHKRGLMQQLFPREGETIPLLRFPEFRKAKPWRKRKISEVLAKMSIPVSVDPERTYREIGVRSHGKGIFHKDPVSGAAIAEKRVFQVVEDALVLNIVFAWEQAVATTSKDEVGMIASHRFPMYVPRSEGCDVRFMKYALLNPQGKDLLHVASPGGAGRNRTLGQDIFEDSGIIIPDKGEQARVADCIRSLEDLIAFQTATFEALRNHKRGLMQRLFPSEMEAES
jgi:type I restriction enzyme, S subunit